MATKIRTWYAQDAAKADRRKFIDAGYSVSLIVGVDVDGIDGYAFEVYDA